MTDKEIHERFVRFGAEAREWIRRCKLLLPRVKRRGIWRQHGCSSIYEYAAKFAGLSRWQVDDALRVCKKLEGRPLLREVAAKKGLAAVRPVVTIVDDESEAFWAEKAREMSRNTLRTYVREFRLKNGAGPKLQVKNVPVELPANLARRLEEFKKREDFVERLEKFLDSVEQAPEPVRSSRHIPAHIRRFVLERTGGKCAFPGCRRDYAILHHTQRWALNKVHDPQRLQPLCKAHERLAHLGLIENEEGPAHTWRIRREPDRNNYKFFVDQQVGLYRRSRSP